MATKMIILDTNILIDYFRGKKPVVDFIDQGFPIKMTKL